MGRLSFLPGGMPSISLPLFANKIDPFLKKKKKKTKRDDLASSSVAVDMEAGPLDIVHGNM